MTLADGKRLGAVQTPRGWELTIPAFTRRDGSEQPASIVRWPIAGRVYKATLHRPDELISDA